MKTPAPAFAAALAEALGPPRTGFAAGKIGFSEQYWLNYPSVLAAATDARAVRAYELGLRTHLERQAGIYPPTPSFAREFVARFASDLRTLDVIGTFGTRIEGQLVRTHRLPGMLIPYKAMEPDRSVPADDAACYLPLLRGARILIVAPFADLLRERANERTFERIWSRTGCDSTSQHNHRTHSQAASSSPLSGSLHELICLPSRSALRSHCATRPANASFSAWMSSGQLATRVCHSR